MTQPAPLDARQTLSEEDEGKEVEVPLVASEPDALRGMRWEQLQSHAQRTCRVVDMMIHDVVANPNLMEVS